MAVNPVKTPFTNMSFTPDVPSSALQPQEYNQGYNIETDTRGILSVLGDQYILQSIPGNAIFVTSGFRANNLFWFIIATEQGKWYATDGSGSAIDITPVGIGNFTGYNTSTVITASWNGNVLFINDMINPPMYLLADKSILYLYDNPPDDYVWNYSVSTLAGSGIVASITGSGPWTANITSLPSVSSFQIGQTLSATSAGGFLYTGTPTSCVVTAVDSNFGNVTYQVTSTGNSRPVAGAITVIDTPLYSSLTAGFIRVYNSPNLGSLLVAGNLTGNVIATGTTVNYPTTVRWSQNFGLNSGPTSWAPTLTNTANEVEMPVRGPILDGFPLIGNFYICSYWDTCVMSPIAYQSSTAPVFGIKLVNQGRGMLNENCWVNVDNTVFGLDARDIWQFDGGNFKAIGNQRVKDYFYNNLNADYTNQIFMVHNSYKYQIEIYYPDLYSTGQCNQMISYRYDLDVWQPPRSVTFATQATEAPRYFGNVANLATRGVIYSTYLTDTSGNTHLIQKDTGTSFLGNSIPTLFQRNNISFGQTYSSSVQVHRVYPEIYGTGNIQITVGGANSVDSTPTFKPTQTMAINTENPWVQINQNEFRVNTLQVSSNSSVDSWQMTAANWQVTQVQDTR